jgi:hypothetical protein
VNLSKQVAHLRHPDEYLTCHMDLLTDTDSCISTMFPLLKVDLPSSVVR